MTDPQLEQLPEPPLAEYREFAARTNLETALLNSLHAERHRNGDFSEAQFSFGTEYAIEGQRLFFRLRAITDARSADGDDLARIEAHVSVSFRFEGIEPSKDIAVRFAVTSGSLVAMPFVREVVTNTALRLGIPNLLMPLVPIPT